MKRWLSLVALASLPAFVSGCPIYEDTSGCFDDLDCPSGSTCDVPSGLCVAAGGGAPGRSCSMPSQCSQNETCSADRTCKSGSCRFHGCVAGWACGVADRSWQCISTADAGPDSSDASEGGVGGSSGAGGAAGGGGDAAAE